LQEGDHIVFDHMNRGLVAGTTTRLSAIQPSVAVGLVVVIFGAVLSWLVAGRAGPVIVLVGALFTAAATVVGLRKKARLEEHGWLLTAEVTKVDEQRGWTSMPYPGGMVRSYTLTVSYRLLTPTGEQRDGVVRRHTSESRPLYPVPSPGDKLAILYAEGITERVM